MDIKLKTNSAARKHRRYFFTSGSASHRTEAMNLIRSPEVLNSKERG